MELTGEQAEMFPMLATSPAVKQRSRVRQFIEATLKHGPLLTPMLAAEALGVSRQRVHTLINDDRIATVIVGTERLIPATAVDLYKAEEPRPPGRPWPSVRRLLAQADRIAEHLTQ